MDAARSTAGVRRSIVTTPCEAVADADTPADEGGDVIAFPPALERCARQTLRNCLQNWCST